MNVRKRFMVIASVALAILALVVGPIQAQEPEPPEEEIGVEAETDATGDLEPLEEGIGEAESGAPEEPDDLVLNFDGEPDMSRGAYEYPTEVERV